MNIAEKFSFLRFLTVFLLVLLVANVCACNISDAHENPTSTQVTSTDVEPASQHETVTDVELASQHETVTDVEPVTAVCEHNYEWVVIDVHTSHCMRCVICGEEQEQEAHAFNWSWDENLHTAKCGCGAEFSAEHSLQVIFSSEKHNWVCQECGYYGEPGEHKFSWVEDEEGGKHSHICQECGYVDEECTAEAEWFIDEVIHCKGCEKHTLVRVSSHTFVDGVCTVCGYKQE